VPGFARRFGRWRHERGDGVGRADGEEFAVGEAGVDLGPGPCCAAPLFMVNDAA
jgi:hypothetical protein